jgi:hypothetical protein
VRKVVGSPADEIPAVVLIRDGDDLVGGVRPIYAGGAQPPRPLAFDTDERVALGRFLITQARLTAGEPSRTFAERVLVWANDHRDYPRAAGLLARLDHPAAPIDLGWNAAWALSGFQRVLVGHKLAASLMATHADDPDVMSCAPWDAYTIEIQPELVQVPDANGRITSFDVVAVWHCKGDATSYMNVYSRSSPDVFTGRLEFPLPPFDEEALEQAGSDAVRTAMTRAIECVARLVVGTELEMTERDRVKLPPRARGRAGKGEPCGVHRLLREVKIDCRASVSSYIAGTRKSSPSVRTLVPGHFQRYAVGPGRAQRRWQPKEPYWRGPEAGPVAVRPHRFPGSE